MLKVSITHWGRDGWKGDFRPRMQMPVDMQ